MEAATRYYYQVGSEGSGFSSEYSFVSAPAPGAATEADVFAFGDMGTLLPFKTAEEQQVGSVRFASTDVSSSHCHA